MLVDYLETLPDHQAVFDARQSLNCFGWEADDGELLTAWQWVTRYRDRLDVTPQGIMHPAGARYDDEELTKFVEWMQSNN